MNHRRFLKKLNYAALLVRTGGTGVLVRQMLSRLYSTVNYIWLAKNLNSAKAADLSQIPYSIHPAAPKDFKTVLASLERESGQDVFEILRRRSFYERGFDACYLASTEAGAVCHLAWLLSANHNDLIQSQYPPGMKMLDEADVLLENIFTFAVYRSRGVMTSVTEYLADAARKQGYSRILAYVDINNKASLRAFMRSGFYSCGTEKELRRFFKIWRTGHNVK